MEQHPALSVLSDTWNKRDHIETPQGVKEKVYNSCGNDHAFQNHPFQTQISKSDLSIRIETEGRSIHVYDSRLFDTDTAVLLMDSTFCAKYAVQVDCRRDETSIAISDIVTTLANDSFYVRFARMYPDVALTLYDVSPASKQDTFIAHFTEEDNVFL